MSDEGGKREMKNKVKAAVLTSKERIEIMEFPIPETGENDALLHVEACGYVDLTVKLI